MHAQAQAQTELMSYCQQWQGELSQLVCMFYGDLTHADLGVTQISALAAKLKIKQIPQNAG